MIDKPESSGLLEISNPNDLARIIAYLNYRGTLDIKVKSNGLYSASGGQAVSIASGYQHTWLRDTIMIANYEREIGNIAIAGRTIKAVTKYLCSQRFRFLRIIENPALKMDEAERPHIRFDGNTLLEIPEPWPHAQNDALGYCLWFVFSMANQGFYELDALDFSVYSMFPCYFWTIEYWCDQDSGHWEESPKVNNSSIGVIVGALREMRTYLERNCEQNFIFREEPVTAINLAALEAKGREALYSLPYESYPDRKADAALIFLIYPMQVVATSVADLIIEEVVRTLLGPYGIRRYEGDSFWCQDYNLWAHIDDRPSNFTGFLGQRDSLLRPGCEAQWCIFDPILSICYGRRYLVYGREDDLQRQMHYLNRALSQLTSEAECAELYYLHDGKYAPNDHTPLAWTQANLGTALEYMGRSFRQSAGGPRRSHET